MSIVITQTPPSLIFSADLISVKFACSNYLNSYGTNAINSLAITTTALGTSFVFKYGAKNITMFASAAPDDSGLQFLAGVTVVDLIPYFKENYDLNNDFEITSSGSNVIFTAKNKGYGFNFSGAGSNTLAGSPQVIKPNYTVLFKLYLENATYTGFELIYTANLNIIAGSAGIVEAPIGERLHSAITRTLREEYPDQPAEGMLLCKKSCRKYYFQYAESYGEPIAVRKLYTSEQFTAVHGGFSTLAQFNQTLISLIAPGAAITDRFLKQGNTEVYTRSNQPQYLYFFNTRATRSISVKVLFTFIDDTTELREVLSATSLESFRKYAFNVRFDQISIGLTKQVVKYKIYLESESERVSEERTYWLDYKLRNYVRYFLSWSSFGSFDSRICFGKGESEFELFTKNANRIARQGDDIKAGTSFTYNSKIQRSFKVATGFMSRRELIGNADFFLSNFKYRYSGGLLLPIEVVSGKISELQDGEHLMAQRFDYRYLFDDHAYTEGDAEDPGASAGSFFFSAAAIGQIATGLEETDPTVPSWVKGIKLADINKWNAGTGGSGGIENDPTVPAWVKSITLANIIDWNTALNDLSDYLDHPVKTTSDVRHKSISSTSYASGFAGSGWKIDEFGNATFDNITVRKSLNVFELVINKISATNGALAITDSIKILSITETPTTYDCFIDTADNTIAVPFRVNDLLRCQVWNGRSIKYYLGKVISYSTGVFSIEKSTIIGAGIPEPGDEVVRFGNTTNLDRQGLLYLSASDSNAPYIDVLDGVNSDNLAGKTKVRLGKLDGITDADFGPLSGYGIFTERGYFKGKIMVTGGNAQTIAGSQSIADNAKSEAITAAQAAAQGYTDTKALATLNSAQTYTQSEALSQANIAKASAIAIAATTAQTKADAAQANAATLSNQLINGLKIGGRNFALNSSTVLQTNAYLIGTINLSENIENNTQITITAWANLATGQQLYVGLSPSATPLVIISKNASGNFSETFTFYRNPGGSDVANKLMLYNYPSGGSLTGSITKIKVEKGNKSTDWLPAPEDVQAAIDLVKTTADAAKTSFDALTLALSPMAYQDITQWAINGKTLIQGGYINAALIRAAIVEANIVRTGSSGARIEIFGSNFIMTHSNGNKAVEWKIVDGIVRQLWFDVNGNQVFDVSKNGITYVTSVAESWSLVKLTLVSYNLSDTESNLNTAFENSTALCTKQFSTTNYRGLNNTLSAYYYSAGKNAYSDANLIYEGYKSANGSKVANITDGWYTIADIYYGATNEYGDITTLVTYQKIVSGVVVTEIRSDITLSFNAKTCYFSGDPTA